MHQRWISSIFNNFCVNEYYPRFEKATEILLRLGNVQKDSANKSAYFKTMLSIIIVQLAAGDEVEAGKRFQEFCM